MKGKYRISCRVKTAGRNEVEVTGKHFKNRHITLGKILSETRDLICEAGKHYAPRYYCTASNGRDDIERKRNERL